MNIAEGTAAIERSTIRNGANTAPVLSLFFDSAARPDASVIRRLAEEGGGFSISHGSAEGGDGERALPDWLELLANGLTYDLSGLAPGEPYRPATAAYRFDLPDSLDTADIAAVSLVAGPHLAGGEAMLPVVRSQVWLASNLCALPGVAAIGWESARSLSSVGHFTASVERWLDGGVFPGLGLTALAEDGEGGMRSEGLAFFTGQELSLDTTLLADKAGAARLALRLINELVGRSKLERAERIKGPAGEALLISPSEDGRTLHVAPDRE